MPRPTLGDPYLYARAEAELDMAQRATSREAVRAHYDLANLYLAGFYKGQSLDQPTGRRARSAWASVPSSR